MVFLSSICWTITVNFERTLEFLKEIDQDDYDELVRNADKDAGLGRVLIVPGKTLDFTNKTNKQVINMLAEFCSKKANRRALGDHIFAEGFEMNESGQMCLYCGS